MSFYCKLLAMGLPLEEEALGSNSLSAKPAQWQFRASHTPLVTLSHRALVEMENRRREEWLDHLEFLNEKAGYKSKKHGSTYAYMDKI